MNDVNIRAGAVQYPIGEHTTFRWTGIPKPIYRAKFSIVRGTDSSRPFDFVAKLDKMGKTADTVEDMSQFAAERAMEAPLIEGQPQNFLSSDLFSTGGVRRRQLEQSAKTPFDLKVPQCWLLVELDPSVNWSFSDLKPPCHAKHPDPAHPSGKMGANVSLRAVYPDGDVRADPTTRPNDRYRFIFFGVVHRTGQDSDPPAFGEHHLNFEVLFLDDQGTLPVTIDPDVGNEGPDEFPSPP